MGGNYNLQEFHESLEASKEGVWKIARWLSDQGHQVTVNSTAKTPSVGQRALYSDSGDLSINQRIEVKQISADFTSADDWPYSCMLLCSKTSWESASPKPHAIIHLSASGNTAAVVMGSTSERWKVVSRQPKGDPYPHENMATDLGNVRFFTISDPKKDEKGQEKPSESIVK